MRIKESDMYKILYTTHGRVGTIYFLAAIIIVILIRIYHNSN